MIILMMLNVSVLKRRLSPLSLIRFTTSDQPEFDIFIFFSLFSVSILAQQSLFCATFVLMSNFTTLQIKNVNNHRLGRMTEIQQFVICSFLSFGSGDFPV